MASTTGRDGPVELPDGSSKPIRPRRPNYNLIHAQPLPVKVYPLPQLIPHNPLSVISIALTYLIQYFFPPASRLAAKHKAIFSLQTRSVNVTDETSVRALWESGFFGKGSLSRSEPSWLDREKRRKGIIVGETSEEATRRRREERKEFKKERARKERMAIEEKLMAERTVPLNAHALSIENHENLVKKDNVLLDSPERPFNDQGEATFVNAAQDTIQSIQVTSKASGENSTTFTENVPKEKSQPNQQIENQEHLQLSLEEAFFLAFGLGVLEVQLENQSKFLSNETLFKLCRQNSYFPPAHPLDLRPDDPFLLSYVVYHHFRSLGWVVRSGVKFAVDWLLYNRGPVFSHAEFAVVIMPAYCHPYWHATEDRSCDTKKRESKKWWWLHCVNRVQSQVRKTLVLVYVEVPPPESVETTATENSLDLGRVLKQYKVREFTLKRWIPNRSRD